LPLSGWPDRCLESWTRMLIHRSSRGHLQVKCMQLSEYILLAPLRRCIQEWSGILYHPDYQPKGGIAFLFLRWRNNLFVNCVVFWSWNNFKNNKSLHIDGGKNSVKIICCRWAVLWPPRVCVVACRSGPRAIFLGYLQRAIFASMVTSIIFQQKKVLPFTSPLVHALIFEKDIKYKDDFMMIL